MNKPPLNLSAEQLAQVFSQLHRLEAAGVPCHSSFAIVLHSVPTLRKPLLFMQQRLNDGQAVSEAGFKAGIFTEAHKTLIRAAEESGKLAEVYARLAKHYTGLDSHIKKVKSRLYLPSLIFCISLFIQPLPGLINAGISQMTYLELSLGRLLVIGFVAFLLLKLPRILRTLGAETIWHRLQFGIPGVKHWIVRRQLNEFFFILGLMAESGIAFSESLPKAVDSIKNTYLREQFEHALSLLDSGATVTEMLALVPVIDSTAIQIIDSSEKSGKLAGGLLHFAELEAQNISLQDDALAEWLPRIIYSFIAAWMAYSILSSPYLSITKIPEF